MKHPHARGEDFGDGGSAQQVAETPPRTWGRRAFPTTFAGTGRNTPTHVGKTGVEFVIAHAPQKHPHARGEDRGMTVAISFWRETPPRTWGRPWPDKKDLMTRGNTPTHVGKT